MTLGAAYGAAVLLLHARRIPSLACGEGSQPISALWIERLGWQRLPRRPWRGGAPFVRVFSLRIEDRRAD